MSVENLKFKLDDNGKKATIDIKKLVLSDKELETSINVQTNTLPSVGKLAVSQIRAIIKSTFKSLTEIPGVPYFDERYNLKSSFDSIRLNIENIDKSGGKLHIDGSLRLPTLG
jgi:hypothetical protein